MVDGPKAKLTAADELLTMMDTCIDLSCRLRESGYRIHVSDDSKKAKQTTTSSEQSKSVCFSENMKNKLEILQSILRETSDNLSDF